MSSPEPPRRAALALLLGAGLAGCGFTPVFGPDGGGEALRATIRPAGPDTEIAFAFVRQFEERLGRAATPRWELDYTIVTTEKALAIDGSNNITRFNIEGSLDWTLTAAGSTVVQLSGSETSFTTYAATGSTVSTLESERDAERRLARILADRVVTRLLSEADTLRP
ncbi:LPS assembly lipoprotein LptE [Jannaschia marina]|uniref:LPS assembly lipoprotein LptE n=1 Tax=Jannaschia marina TaxID=2741674 RepID=UPI0015CEBAAB|nr:LPS assembly lipoprotein LptE [Jannaschia marina]